MMERMLKSPAKNLLTRRAIKTVQEMDPIVLAIKIMDELEISALPVVDDKGIFVGVLSRTDIASMRFVNYVSQKSIDQIRVGEMMNRTLPISVGENQSVADVIAIMHKRHIHRVFLRNQDERIIGVVSTTDILKLLFLENLQSDSPSEKSESYQFFNRVKESHERHMEDIGWESL